MTECLLPYMQYQTRYIVLFQKIVLIIKKYKTAQIIELWSVRFDFNVIKLRLDSMESKRDAIERKV